MSETDTAGEGDILPPNALDALRSIAIQAMFGGGEDERSAAVVWANGSRGSDYRERSEETLRFAYSLVFDLVKAGKLEDIIGELDFQAGFPLTARDRLWGVIRSRRMGMADEKIREMFVMSPDVYDFVCDLILALTAEGRLDALGPLPDETIGGAHATP